MQQKIVIRNILRGIILAFALLLIYSASKDFAYVEKKQAMGYYFSVRFEGVLSYVMETTEKYHESNVLTYNQKEDKYELKPEYRLEIQEDLYEKGNAYKNVWEAELENLKLRQTDSSVYPIQQIDIQNRIDELEKKLNDVESTVEAEKVLEVEQDLASIEKEIDSIKNAKVLYINKSVDASQYEAEKSALQRQIKMLTSNGEDYYWFEVGEGSYEIEAVYDGSTRKITGRDGSIIAENIDEPITLDYTASRLINKDGFRLLVFVKGSPEELTEHDIIKNNFRLYLEDLERTYVRAVYQLVAGTLAILFLIIHYQLSKREEKKRKLEGRAPRVNKMDEAVNSLADKLIYFVSNLKLEGKLILFLLALNSVNQVRYFGLNSTLFLHIFAIMLGVIVFADFVQADKEKYFTNSLWHQWRDSRRTKRFTGLAKRLEFLFDGIFVIGSAIILCYLYSVIDYNLYLPVMASVLGGLVILFMIWELYFKLLDERMGYIDEISAELDKIVKGTSNADIPVRENNPFSDLAENINKMKEGYGTAMEEKMKSERMKTELITNVSHDLKTPLTSIINYIDLLKKEDVEPEYARDYIRVLDQKAERLNALIQDLFEASKAASGDLTLEMEYLDVAQLLRQTLAEMDGKIEESQLRFVTHIPKEPVMVYADGNRLHRVFDNLIINILKYTLQGTRVYINLVKNGTVKIVMKNIANYEMNFDQEEIVQRFTRGDQARSSEGSGLGLAISQGLIDLMGMKMTIQTDGDLFKVEIEMDKLQRM